MPPQAPANVLFSSETGGAPRLRTAVLTAIFIVATCVRLAFNAQFQGMSNPPDPDMGPDAVMYNALGESLATGRGYTLEGKPSLHYPPGVPFLLSAVYGVGGVRYPLSRTLFSVLGGLTCVLVALLIGRMAGAPWGVLAGLGLAIYPEHAYWSMHFLPEVPSGLLFAAVALTCVSLDAKPSFGRAALLGVLLGASALVSPRNLLVVPAFVVLVALYHGMDVVRTWGRSMVVAGLFMAAVIAPWTARNYAVSGTPTLISAHGGSTFLQGNNALVFSDPALIGSWYSGDHANIPGYEDFLQLPDAERSTRATELAIAFLKGLSYTDLVKLEVMKAYRFLSPITDTPNAMYRWVIAISWSAVAPFVIWGAIASWRDRRAAFMHAVLAAYLAITVVFFGEPRYRATLAPLLVAYATLGVKRAASHLDVRVARRDRLPVIGPAAS